MSEAAPRALVLDDNLMFAMMVEPPLKRLGYQVRTMAGSPAAVEVVGQWEPQVVFVNLASSRCPGADLIRALRGGERPAAIAIVGYAGHVERHLFEAGREAGADLVVPNSALRGALPQVLEKLRKRLAGEAEAEDEWSEEAG